MLSFLVFDLVSSILAMRTLGVCFSFRFFFFLFFVLFFFFQNICHSVKEVSDQRCAALIVTVIAIVPS